MALRIPITVSGRGDGFAWGEPTHTEDISTVGVRFELSQKVKPGELLTLRIRGGGGAAVEVTGRVTRTSSALFGRQKVGIQIADPDEIWHRLFVSWAAQEG